MANITVMSLRRGTLSLLSAGLNDHKVIPSDNGLPRDWRGLSHLIGLNGVETNRIASSKDQMATLINYWGEKGTIEQLQQFLALIDRYDVLDDTTALIEQDIEVYKQRVSTSDQRVKSSSSSNQSDSVILTTDDVMRLEKGLQPQIYDAYLLYAEEDVEFACSIVETMENQHGLKFCLRDRDLVGGITFEIEAVMKLIAERCRRLLVVVTSSFLRSPANKFFVTFAQALGIDQQKRKVIPILYEKCELPPELSFYFLLDYSRAGVLYNFWDKLRDSILAPDVTSPAEHSASPWMMKSKLGVASGKLEEPTESIQKEKAEETATKEVLKNGESETPKKHFFKNVISTFSNVVSSSKVKIGTNSEESSNKSTKKWRTGKKKVAAVLP